MEGQRLLERILDGAEDPTDLPFALLQDITDNFSEERKIGEGGFGEVYKGVLGERTVAVKRIHINVHTVDDKLFRREATSLMKINHRNIVRFLGVCSQGIHKPIEQDGSGKYIWVKVLERLLCFEYISNGSLDKYITDELRGLEWEARYEIITGICKGLRYLHNDKNIIHMDLKPANVLLHHQDNKYMVPKISDFGLARSNKNSHTVGQLHGTPEYMAPEYRRNSEITYACDIYSLGVIIIELVTGCKDFPHKDYILRRWRQRWSEPPTQLRYQQVTRCIYIAEWCREPKPEARPSISKIISFLNDSENTHTPINPCFDEDTMLKIKPLELLLPYGWKNEISRSVELTNDTPNCIAFNIQSPSVKYIVEPVKGIVQPKSKCYVKIIVQPRDVREHNRADKFVVKSMQLEATDGVKDEDTTEHISRAEANKVVDKVDLMVVYEPTKPLENSRSRDDMKMPAEELSKDKRNIVESASRKGKSKLGKRENAEATSMDISPSGQGRCTEQTEQCYFHPLQSFSRHSPTNEKYLGKKSPCIDHASGAMGSLLDKLGKLVTEDYSLETSTKSDIDSLSIQLKKMQIELPKLENADGAEVLVDKVREMSYNIEDMVDSFLVRVKPDSNRSGFRELKGEGLKIWENGMMTQHHIRDVIKDINNQVQVVVHMKEEYHFNVYDVATNSTTKDDIDSLRNLAIYEDNKELVGIETPRDELMRLFDEDGDVSKQNLKIVSIVGLGGLGKTTLAKAVYDAFKAQCHTGAFVPVGRNPDVENVLKSIIYEIDNACNAEKLHLHQLIKKIKELLENKRYFIVIDDIWDSSSWKLINSAFPRNNPGSRVITTTRIHNVALATCNSEREYVYNIRPLSDEDARRLFFKRTFPKKGFPDTPRKEEITKCIMKTCGGMPLSIKSIASLLAGEPDSTWENVWKSLGALTDGKSEEKTDIDNMKQILDLSYMYLPDDLKTCLLYVCKYPEDREIDKIDLLRQWVAEGFVRRKGLLDAEDVAENNFKALINMCMIEAGKIDYNNEVLSCRVHDIILDIMRSKSSEVNFVQVIDGLKDVSGPYGEIRRVSIHYNCKEDGRILETIKGSLSHARSFSVYRDSLVPYFFLEFKYVRVLHIEHEYYEKDQDLTGISRLFLLRYLKFACSRQSHYDLKLPDQIGQLQQLETLDLDRGFLKNYPSDIVSLPWMSHLICGGRGVVLPDGIDRLKSLRTLVGVCVYKSSVESIKGLSMLTNLRRLQICSNESEQSEEATSMRMDALHSSICKLSANLGILNIGEESTVILNVRGWIKSLFPHASNIRELYLGCCNFQRCPEWIGLLDGLYKFSIMVSQVADGVSIVARLPSLAYLCLFTGHKAKEESVVVPGSGAFQSLKHLIFNCPKASLTFEAEAMPKLEKLQILFRFHMARRFMPAGIEYLQAHTLKKISLRVASNDMTAKGYKDPEEDDRYTYWGSDEYEEELWYHTSSLRRMLKRAFKQHHPHADIAIHFEEGFKDEEYGDIEDDDKMKDEYIDAVEEDGNEEDNDEQDDEDCPCILVRRERINRNYVFNRGEHYEL